MKKAVLYARVSSTKQDKDGFSIPAQIKFLHEYAKKNNFEIVKEFVEAETAKKAGRKQFNSMVSYLQENEDSRVILVEKVDRLYRNFVDSCTIDNIKGLEIHFVKENEILSEKSRSSIKFMIGMRVLMAKQYIENLAEESKKGLDERIEQGYALYPALGYKYGDDGTHKHAIIIDPERAPYAKRIFEMFVYDNYSAYTINNILYDEGLRNPDGNKYAVSTIQRMLRNVMYIGDYMYQGKYYPNGKHPALISRELFQLAQKKLNSADDKTRKHEVQFPYIGMFKCGVCGCSYTAELKKKPSGKQYVYYHCTGKGKIKTCKKESYISESKIDAFLAEILKGLSDIPQYVIDVIKNELKIVHDLKNEYSIHSQKNIEKRIKEIDRMIQNGYKRMLKNNNEHENELWNTTYQALREEKEELRNQQLKFDKADDDFYKQSDLILKFCKNIDIDLYPVFYDILSMKYLGTEKIAGFELPEISSGQQKRASEKALDLNGGTDEARTRDLLRDRQTL